MRLHVAFHPSLLATGSQPPVSATRPQVCVVVDVMRASTTIIAFLERGASPIYVASGIEAARVGAAAIPGAVLAGELDGIAPPGFDYGNSPVEVSTAEIEGRAVIFATTNGTVAIRAVEGLGPVLIGALRNAGAVADEAAASSRDEACDLTIICAGREGSFGIDDAYCAGALADRLLARVSFDLTDGAEAALRLYRSEPDAPALFMRSAAGRNITRLGLAPDIDYCAESDASTIVPRLGRELRMLDDGGADR